MDAPVVFIVRFWIKPGAQDTVLAWLDGGHIAEVVGEPGFLWARRYRLDAKSGDGWPAYAMIYGLASMEELQTYFNGEAPKRFARERAEKGLDDLMRVERDWGTVEFGVEAN